MLARTGSRHRGRSSTQDKSEKTVSYERTQLRNGRSTRGFTLIEVLLVLIIVATLAAVVLPNLVGRAEQGRRAAAQAQIASFKTGLNSFELDNGRFPTTAEGLEALLAKPPTNNSLWKGPYLDGNGVPRDPWNQAYLYRHPGTFNPDGYDLFSNGRDGEEGTNDDVGNIQRPSR